MVLREPFYLSFEQKSFHSINIPNEWGSEAEGYCLPTSHDVSIQLISPTSGDEDLRI